MATNREVIETTIALERESMTIYTRFGKVFDSRPEIRDFWFGMARDEASHVGALNLVATVLELDGKLDQPASVGLSEATVARVRSLLADSGRQSLMPLDRALEIALEVEETEIEDLVADLLKAVAERGEYERYLRLLVHDLGELSYMIERHCSDPKLLARCDVLVNRHAENLCKTATGR
jgi:rubrerythrin